MNIGDKEEGDNFKLSSSFTNEEILSHELSMNIGDKEEGDNFKLSSSFTNEKF